MKKQSLKAAAILAATVSLSAEAAIVCTPVYIEEQADGSSKQMISSECDAAAFNAKHQLRKGFDGCAVPGQRIAGGRGYVREQALYKHDVKPAACEDHEAAIFAVEL